MASQGCWWATNLDAWVQAIGNLIQNRDLRGQLLEASQKALEAHDLSQTAPMMLRALESTEPNRGRVLYSLPRTQTEARADVDVDVRRGDTYLQFG